MNVEFEGQVVLITGGTRGIGREIAAAYASLGATIFVTGRNEVAHSEFGFLRVDFADPASVQSFLARIDSFERIDVLVNNAGINRINAIDDTKTEDWEAIRSVNLDGPFLVTRAASRIMKRNRYGRIVNIGSIFGVISKARRVLYSMSKYGLRGLTVGSAIDLAKHGILVNTVSPGFVLTELTRSILSKEEIGELTDQVPLGRFADPAEIAKVVLFLTSRENTYITGQNIIVDGGFVSV